MDNSGKTPKSDRTASDPNLGTDSGSVSQEIRRGVDSTSRSLLAGLRDDDPEAWNRLVKLYTPLVYYWCRKLNLSDQDIPDVLQEVFRAVALNMDRFRKEQPQDTFRGWLRTIARSKVMDHFRRQRDCPKAVGGTGAHQQISEVPAVPTGDDSDDRSGHDALFVQSLELIKNEFQERTWKAFWRVVVDGQSPKDVANELGMKPGAVRVSKCRVLHRLRLELGDLSG